MLRQSEANRGRLTELMARHAVLIGSGLLVVLGLFVAGVGLGSKPFWNDEAASAQFAMRSFRQLLETLITREYIMAGYQLLLWPWSRLAGTSEAMLRLPSLVFALTTIPIVVLIARRVLTLRWALLAGLLLTLSGYFVNYAQEARGYALILLLGSLSLLTLLRAVEHPTWTRWLIYAGVAAIGVWSQPVMGFLVAGQAAAVLLHPLLRVWWRQAAAAYTLLAVAALPLGLLILLLGSGRWVWIGDASLDHVVRQMRVVAGHGDLPALTLWVVAWLAGGAAALAAYRRDGEGNWARLLIATSAATALLGPLAVSALRPMFIARYLITALPPLVILAGLFLSSIRERAVALVLVAALLIISADGVLRWHFDVVRADWRGAASLVLESQEPGDAIAFFSGSTVFADKPRTYRYYVAQLEPDAREPVLVRLPAANDGAMGERMKRALDGHSRLWVVGSRLGRPVFHDALGALEQSFDLTQSQSLEGGLEVRLYVRAPDAG